MLTYLSSCKGILIDLDDTLYDYGRCNAIAQKALIGYLAKKLALPQRRLAEALSRARKETKKILGDTTAACHSRLFYCQKTIEELTTRTDPSLTIAAHNYFWHVFMRHMRLFPGAREFLVRAKKKKRIICIVTNMIAAEQLQKISALGIDRLINYVVSSEEAGREKPHPAALRLALRKMQLRPREVVMIGEDEYRDGESARRAGITPIFFRLKPKNASAFFVKNFKELTKIFGL